MNDKKTNITFDNIRAEIADIDNSNTQNYNQLNTKIEQATTSINASVESITNNFNDLKTDIESNLNNFNEKLVNAENIVTSFETKVNETEDKLISIDNSLSDFGNTINYVNNKVSDVENSVTTLSDSLSTLETNVGNALTQNLQQDNRISNKVDKTTTINGKSLETNITLTATDIGALSEIPSEYVTETELSVKANQSDLNTTNSNLTIVTDAVGSLGSQIHALQMQDQTHTTLINSLSSSLNNKVDSLEMENVYFRLNTQQANISTLTENIEDIQSKNSEQDSIINLKANQNDLESTNLKINNQITSIENELTTINSNISQLETKNSTQDDTIATKVDKVSGKGLSTNDYTTAEKNKLSGIQAGAQVNPTIDSSLSATSTNPVQNKVITQALSIQCDWNNNDETSIAYIKNKPVIPDGAILYNTTGTNTDGSITQNAITTQLGYKADVSLLNVEYPSCIANGELQRGAADRVIHIFIATDKKSWYRKWLSGWKECGAIVTNSSGQGTYTLPIEFSNLNYIAVGNVVSSGNSNFGLSIKQNTESTIKFTKWYSGGQASEDFMIYCCGF